MSHFTILLLPLLFLFFWDKRDHNNKILQNLSGIFFITKIIIEQSIPNYTCVFEKLT